jgi:peptide chain release factor 2
MLGEELQELLKKCEPNLSAIAAFWKNAGFENKFNDLHTAVNQEQFWQHENRNTLASEHKHLKELIESYQSLLQSYNEYNELITLFCNDESHLESIKTEIYKLVKGIAQFKIELLLNKKEDQTNCYLSINAGAGGTESQDWASMLLRMYLRFCERESYKVDILDYQTGEEAGIKSATLYIRKKNATGFLKAESGIHRLVRISPFDANKRRHTSFAAVTIMAESEDAKIEILDKDLRIDTYRAGGAGGQHVNKTDSAVRITHLPTNIVVQCQNERSQLQNKQTALKMLKSKLVELQESEKRAHKDSLEKKKIEWGSQIRNYVMQPYKLVKDVRTGVETSDVDSVMDGYIDEFLKGFLMQQGSASSVE